MTRSIFGAAALLALWVQGCSIDTELGVAVTFDAASVAILGAGPEASVASQGIATFRVGANALGPQSFVPTALELYLVDRLVAGFVPDGSDVGLLAPGEMRTVTLSGGPDLVAGADSLCGQEVRVRLLYRFTDDTGVSTMPTFRDAERTTRDVRCE